MCRRTKSDKQKEILALEMYIKFKIKLDFLKRNFIRGYYLGITGVFQQQKRLSYSKNELLIYEFTFVR